MFSVPYIPTSSFQIHYVSNKNGKNIEENYLLRNYNIIRK